MPGLTGATGVSIKSSSQLSAFANGELPSERDGGVDVDGFEDADGIVDVDNNELLTANGDGRRVLRADGKRFGRGDIGAIGGCDDDADDVGL